jgi:hypothetical protein
MDHDMAVTLYRSLSHDTRSKMVQNTLISTTRWAICSDFVVLLIDIVSYLFTNQTKTCQPPHHNQDLHDPLWLVGEKISVFRHKGKIKTLKRVQHGDPPRSLEGVDAVQE